MRKILIIGATSAIAQATAKLFAQQHDALFLVGRDADKLEAIAADLKVRGAHQVDYTALDLNEFDKHPSMPSITHQFPQCRIATDTHSQPFRKATLWLYCRDFFRRW